MSLHILPWKGKWLFHFWVIFSIRFDNLLKKCLLNIWQSTSHCFISNFQLVAFWYPFLQQPIIFRNFSPMTLGLVNRDVWHTITKTLDHLPGRLSHVKKTQPHWSIHLKPYDVISPLFSIFVEENYLPRLKIYLRDYYGKCFNWYLKEEIGN